MAAYSVETAKHATLVAATEDTVTFTHRGRTLVIRNRDASGGDTLYFRFDGTAAVAAADNTYVLTPGQTIAVDNNGGFPAAISLISAGTPDYSTEVY